ncbi:MAG: broad specificity phosphatase PhoE [Sphingobacteriales bacterium]
MSATKELFIIRHGQTDLNKVGIIQGRGVDAPLNELGELQAKKFYSHFKNEGFEKVYISELVRTYQSAKDFIEVSKIPFERLGGLDEFDWGIYEGTKADRNLGEIYGRITQAWQNGNYDEKIPKGESPNQVKLRQDKALGHILSGNEKKVLVCMHGRAIRLLLTTLTGKPISEMDNFPHQNLTLYKIIVSKEGNEVVKFNNVDHLEHEL